MIQVSTRKLQECANFPLINLRETFNFCDENFVWPVEFGSRESEGENKVPNQTFLTDKTYSLNLRVDCETFRRNNIFYFSRGPTE